MSATTHTERDEHGLTVAIPGPRDRRLVPDVIYDELCQGIVSDRPRAEYRRIMRDLADCAAEGILLGCPEIDHTSAPPGTVRLRSSVDAFEAKSSVALPGLGSWYQDEHPGIERQSA